MAFLTLFGVYTVAILRCCQLIVFSVHSLIPLEYILRFFTPFLFNMEFPNLFGGELMPMENVTLEPPFPLENRRDGLTKILSGTLTYTMRYNSYSKHGQGISSKESLQEQ